MKYIERTMSPNEDNKYYIHTSYGGLNSCILISGNSVLPNCVGYAWGRAYEILGAKPTLSRGNAEDWYSYKDGYNRGKIPKLGSIVCWKKGETGDSRDGAGHVAVVEEINSDGSILISNSSYNGTKFWIKNLNSDYYLSSNYDFQGFIYLPVEFEEEELLKTVEQLANEVIAGKWGNNPERKKLLEESGYDYNLVQNKVNEILNGITYTVKKGDTLSSIAKQYNTTWTKIYENNKNIIGSNPNLIQIGTKLTIK